jgi:hypothetical protein
MKQWTKIYTKYPQSSHNILCHRKICTEIQFLLLHEIMCYFQSVRTKKRKLRCQKKSDSTSDRNVEDEARQKHGIPISTQSFRTYTFLDSVHNMAETESSFGTSLYPVWLKTSDSDFSDTEAGQIARNRVTQGRVRKSALLLLMTITKVTVWLSRIASDVLNILWTKLLKYRFGSEGKLVYPVLCLISETTK